MQIRSKNDVKQFLSHFNDYVVFPEALEVLPIIDDQGNVWNLKFKNGKLTKEIGKTKEVIDNATDYIWENRKMINYSLR